MDPHADLVGFGVALDDAEQLDDVAEATGDRDLRGGDLADALVVDVAGDDLLAERDGCDDRGLRTGVVALDVGGRVTLGVPEALRVLQRRAVVGIAACVDGIGHLREDVVRRAVDDPEDAGDRFAVEALAQHPDERDPGCDRRLEQQVASGGVGRGVELGTDVREQFLVRGDDRLAVGERGEDQLAGRLDATDRLDDEIDGRDR